MVTLNGQQILILKEGTERTTGRDAQRNNILAARTVADAVKSALGPKGADKMLVDNYGDIVITNDGATILKELDVQHPAAKFVINLAETQDSEIGDGTTSVVVIVGELLKQSEELLDAGIHPTVIVEGYRMASEKAQTAIEKMKIPIADNENKVLKEVATTSMASKLVSGDRDHLGKIVVDAVKAITTSVEGKKVADIDQILIQKKKGGSLADTSLVDGIILDKEVVHSEMPTRVEKAKILLTDKALEVSKTEMDAKIRIKNPNDVQAFIGAEQGMLERIVKQIKDSGANVVLAQKGIDDVVQHYLANADILTVRRVKKSDMEKLAKATGGTIVSDLKNLKEGDAESEFLGKADLVEERRIGEDAMVFIEGCTDAKAVTILVRGGTDLILDEAERALHDANCATRQVIQEAAVVTGGGSPEISISQQLREFAKSQKKGKVTMAIQSFANAMEIIPKTLAENAGLDPIDILSELVSEHTKGNATFGVDPHSESVKDMAKLGVYEPASSKKQMLSSATEAAEMIMRIDDVISAKDLGGAGAPPGGPGADDDFDM